ncbi:F-box/RNI/FBD-like domains-containing protein [Hibiscus syriacus]|uniref:F-box/RNI/FBD-like domains-containing protein n=1 Tax=Hibiscus syriacus TaxID=106335 RepID=A0A6A3D371_HIBSY|nr:stigma-specific STIG1-like protein 1 [Hibiscus syriacus]KAE8736225.1 F-box/RNI/FBD-like domains-containing protein [Hibiscus syriacus]
MKALKIFLVFALFMALAITNLSAAPSTDESLFVHNNDDRSQVDPPSVGITNQFLARKRRASITCNEYPRVCRVPGSPGTDCCKKRCVNVTKDRLNCGKCGRKCKYSEICCKGKCVNPMSDKRHCGGCNNGCDRGSKCLYGMCSYA